MRPGLRLGVEEDRPRREGIGENGLDIPNANTLIVRTMSASSVKWAMGCSGLWVIAATNLGVAPLWHFPQVAILFCPATGEAGSLALLMS